MRRSLLLIVLTFVAVMASLGLLRLQTPTAPSTASRASSSRTESWWVQTPGATGTDFGHVHVGTCFPYLQDVSASVPFDIQVKLHRNPGRPAIRSTSRRSTMHMA